MEEDLVASWRRAGVVPGMHLLVHSSLASLGWVDGGASTVAHSLLNAVGSSGTVVVPAFTPQVSDPAPEVRGVPDPVTRAVRDAVPFFTPALSSPMGAIAAAVRALPAAQRSQHPQASVAAVGARALDVVAAQPLHFAVGRGSPFDRLLTLDARILLVGVGHDRNSFLHHAESLIARPRLKQRRFPLLVSAERVWCETDDVGDDLGAHFQAVGDAFEQYAGIRAIQAGGARVVLLPARGFVAFATHLLQQRLDAASGHRAL